jgi:hypothetical protein
MRRLKFCLGYGPSPLVFRNANRLNLLSAPLQPLLPPSRMSRMLFSFNFHPLLGRNRQPMLHLWALQVPVCLRVCDLLPDVLLSCSSRADSNSEMSIGRLQEQRNSPSSLSTRALTSSPRPVSHLRGQTPGTVPRLVSDGLIHIFFQEWAPFYPVVHQPTVLKYYDNYLTGDTESVQANSHVVAQLNLIFGIAALSSKVRSVAYFFPSIPLLHSILISSLVQNQSRSLRIRAVLVPRP